MLSLLCDRLRKRVREVWGGQSLLPNETTIVYSSYTIANYATVFSRDDLSENEYKYSNTPSTCVGKFYDEYDSYEC